jgi:hypothetical protein
MWAITVPGRPACPIPGLALVNALRSH